MFVAWGSWVARFRWPVFAVTLAAVLGAGVWGRGVFGQLSEGGYHDPSSESTQAAEAVQAALGPAGGDVVVIYTVAQGTVDDPVLGQRVENRLAALPRDAVTASTSYWRDQIAQYASDDKRSGVAVLTLAGDDDSAKLESFREIEDRLSVDGATEQPAGAAVLGDATSELSTRDLTVAEAISLPIVLLLLLFIFGSLVAAALPVMVGGAAVLGSLGVLHAVALHHDVNSFAVNVASLLGLGMAIDYGLFIVGRFREEQAHGRSPADAVTRTVATAGRTVLFSATLLMIALAGLLLFPQGFLKSLAYGGLAAVALAAALSLTMLPAVLAVLGPRVDKLPIRLPRRADARPAGTGWAALADVVLRRPVLITVPLVIGLLLLAAPIRGVHFGEADERVLPAGNPSRQAVERLKADFPALSSAGVQIVLRGADGRAPSAAAGEQFAAQVARVPGVASVSPAGSGADVLTLTAALTGDPFSTAARDAVEDIRAIPPPAGTDLLVGGATARNVDSLTATADRLPLMIALLVGATLLLMFLAFGSVLLPIKAVVVSALSLSATFGILVWIFQDGHGAGLLQITPAPLEVGIVVLMAAVVFGLSTDYEVFLLSRMVEARTRGASTAEAVTTGLARTGRVISAAAILLIVVTGAFAVSSLTTMRFVGIGMILALILDATVVRMLLVPALLGMLGRAAWWAPGPLRRLQERAGLAEYAGEELFPTVSVGRHAAPDTAEPRPWSATAAPPRHAARTEGPAELPPGPVRLRAEAAAAVPPAAAGVPVSAPPAPEPSAPVADSSAPIPSWAPPTGTAPPGFVPPPPDTDGSPAESVAEPPAPDPAPGAAGPDVAAGPVAEPDLPSPAPAAMQDADPDQTQVRTPTEERSPAQRPDDAARAPTTELPSVPVVSGRPMPASARDHAPARVPNGGQPPARVATREPPTVRIPTGDPGSRADTPGDQRPDPESTAVIETDETVGLPSRRDAEDSRRR